MNDLNKARRIDDVSVYVGKHTRYHADAPKDKYTLRHPTPHATALISSNNTHDLVMRLLKIYGIPKK
jgi:hypothetical protein